MTNIFDSLYSGAERSKVQSIDEMIDMLFQVSPEELTARFLFCFDQNKNHMQLLYDAGVVLGRNEGRRFYYRLNEKYFEAVKKLGEDFMEGGK